MDNIAGSKSSLTWAVHISVALLVLLSLTVAPEIATPTTV